ncbi:hypothetical protein [Alkalicoccobacillus plakortidis]|uniref:Lipoprotein n=1 Tax=Alkalicoccobacillus plakortidis TaxID=444060 RepID=A0ABT0XNA4_9BACI|nr:hypothetical protein [Alkalicoccobacillus plakortidis]MCM2677387.1 hypothetical protein [Alkalicoccobacillus plakortidis]
MEKILYLLGGLMLLFLAACGSNDELEDRHFHGESDSWNGEILLEFKPTTEPDF